LPLTEEIRQITAHGCTLKESGRYNEAEACYLEAVKKIDKEDKELMGTLYIDLGKNAEDDNRLDDALKYYSEAISHLEGCKGEPILENAHTHFNMARIYLEKMDNKNALDHAERALEHDMRYPFTAPADLADARAMHLIAVAFVGNPLNKQVLFDTWACLKAVPFKLLNYQLTSQFLLILLPALRTLDPDVYQCAMNEMQSWAGRDVAEEVSMLVEQGPSGLRVSTLRKRLQRSLLRLPDIDK